MAVSHSITTHAAVHEGRLALPPPMPGSGTVDARRRLRRILVATDGTPDSDGALTVTSLLARRHGSTVDVVTALPRWGPPAPVHEVLNVTGELLSDRLERVLPRCHRAFGDSIPWTVAIADGRTVRSIQDAARSRSADLIVTGIRSGLVDRLLRYPTALSVAQAADVPVLVVPTSATSLRTGAVVAIGGSESNVAPLLAAAHDLGLDGEPAGHVVAARRVRFLRRRSIGSDGRRLLRDARCCVLLFGPRVLGWPRRPHASRSI